MTLNFFGTRSTPKRSAMSVFAASTESSAALCWWDMLPMFYDSTAATGQGTLFYLFVFYTKWGEMAAHSWRFGQIASNPASNFPLFFLPYFQKKSTKLLTAISYHGLRPFIPLFPYSNACFSRSFLFPSCWKFSCVALEAGADWLWCFLWHVNCNTLYLRGYFFLIYHGEVGMSKREALKILMLSPFYFQYTLVERKQLLNEFYNHYGVIR